MEIDEKKIEWMNEYIKDVPNRKKLYKFIKKFLFKNKGLTYKELYIILCSLNSKVLSNEECKKHAMLEILSIYKYNNNKMPEEIDINYD
jgi:hypothetical protein